MKTPSTVGSVKSTPRKMNDVSTPKSKRKIDLSAIVEEENDTELPDILNVREKIDDINCLTDIFHHSKVVLTIPNVGYHYDVFVR
jgi:hypothetical protein